MWTVLPDCSLIEAARGIAKDFPGLASIIGEFERRKILTDAQRLFVERCVAKSQADTVTNQVERKS